jgi:hypothetical protein
VWAIRPLSTDAARDAFHVLDDEIAQMRRWLGLTREHPGEVRGQLLHYVGHGQCPRFVKTAAGLIGHADGGHDPRRGVDAGQFANDLVSA